MYELSTSDYLHDLLNGLEREMEHAQALEDSASSLPAAQLYRGVQGGLAFAAGYVTSILAQLEEVGE